VNWFARLWSSLRSWFGRIFRRLPLPPVPASPLPAHPEVYGVIHAEEEPDELEPMQVYALGEGGHLWHISMLCPCGCGEKISLNALPDDSPRWTLEERAGVPSIRPSVWRRVGCRSHFFLRNGSIEWCGR
jgi:hypothetical protein